MKKKKIVAIYTGNRAEYGLQYPIIKAISKHPDLEYRLIVSGAHLQNNFGKTKKEIENDGFKIHSEVKLDMPDDNLISTATAIGSGILRLSQVLKKMKPDIFVVYADRFEGFSALITSTQMGIPTVHLEGGDITEGGALDDMVRHSMTKLAHIHFTTNDDAKKRIIKMGEEPWRVKTVGFPTIDLIEDKYYATPAALVKKYGISLDKPIVLFTQHSIPTEIEDTLKQIRPSIKACTVLAQKGFQVILTYPNNDAGGQRIIKELEKLKKKNLPNIFVIPSLGRYNYHGVLNLCGNVTGGACVGNSSSGIKETPPLKCAFINIGRRQQGRLRAKNVIDVGYNTNQIVTAVEKSTYDKKFIRQCQTCKNPYGEGKSGKKVADFLAKLKIDLKLIQKKMTY